MSIYQKIHQAKLEIGKVSKNAKNPHFKNTYADINALIEAVEPILLEKGLILLQPVINGAVRTEVIDIETGDNVASEMAIPLNLNPQQIGSAITYLRRYTLQSLMSLQAIDDDGNMASAPPKVEAIKPKPIFTELNFEKAIKANATIESIEKIYQISEAIKAKYLKELQTVKS